MSCCCTTQVTCTGPRLLSPAQVPDCSTRMFRHQCTSEQCNTRQLSRRDHMWECNNTGVKTIIIFSRTWVICISMNHLLDFFFPVYISQALHGFWVVIFDLFLLITFYDQPIQKFWLCVCCVRGLSILLTSHKMVTDRNKNWYRMEKV